MKRLIFAFLASALILVCVSLSVSAENGSASVPEGAGGDSSSGGAAVVYTNTVYADGVYKVSANVPEGSIIIFACYEDEALTFVDYMTYTSENADSIQFEVSDEIAYDSAKVFVWDGFAGMNAVKNPEIVNVTKITPLTEFAVVHRMMQGFNDKLEICDIISVYTSEGDEPTDFYVDNDTVMPELVCGDVVVLGFGSDGEVIEIKKLFSPETTDIESMWTAEKVYDEIGNNISNHYIKTGIDAFDNSYARDDGYSARVGFGIIVNNLSFGIEVMRPRGATAAEAAIPDAGIEVGDPVSRYYGSDWEELDFIYPTSDMDVYVYDFEQMTGSRVSKGRRGNLMKTYIPITAVVDMDLCKWNEVPQKIYVFYKTLDGEIKDILIIMPKY